MDNQFKVLKKKNTIKELNVQFITLTPDGEEVFGALRINGETISQGYWRTWSKKQACQWALEIAGLPADTKVTIA